jgi:hypothetical protein
VEYPLYNNQWCGYCEDLTTVGLDWIDGTYDTVCIIALLCITMYYPCMGGQKDGRMVLLIFYDY